MTYFANYEIEAWMKYEDLLAEYHASCNVKSYDRVSIHENFPDIKAAFDKAVSMRTFRLLENNYG